MLSKLYIENIAVIEKTEIDFSSGFNVLTGETGAGKSIVIDAISAVLGRRTSRELVRTGADKAYVSATFTSVGNSTKEVLGSLGIDMDEDELLVEREFTLSGKNNCRINSRPATISMLRELSKFLINIHGQHESYELMSPDLHIGYIDAFGNHREELEFYRAEFEKYKEVCRILSRKDSDERDRLRRADLLRFQIEELETAEITPGEFEILREESLILRNAGKLRDSIQCTLYLLQGDDSEGRGAISLLSDSTDSLSSVSDCMSEVNVLSERLQSVYYDLDDISKELSYLLDSVEDNPQRLEEVETRLELISKMMKKYGESEEEILAYLENIKTELDTIERFEEDKEKLIIRQQELYDLCMNLANNLSEHRALTCEKFSEEVKIRMRKLNMPSAEVMVSREETELTENGIDRLEFLVSTNAGEPVKPVAKVASGGELSRMMLSIKTVLSESEPTDTLIFDEVDSGISGSAALRVGEALCDVSKSAQILCVTHLPQIAAMADAHLLIKKLERDSRTYTEVTPLDDEGRKKELARIIGGENITEAAIQYAGELLSGNY